MAFYVQNFVYVPSLSSPLLLRNYPNTFVFIPIPPMSLSSRNRSNSNAFRHILPRVAPVCESMHYHKTGVPWQMKSTLIINFFSSEISCLVPFCVVLSAFLHLKKTFLCTVYLMATQAFFLSMGIFIIGKHLWFYLHYVANPFNRFLYILFLIISLYSRYANMKLT